MRLVQAGQHGKLRGPGMSAGENQNTFKLRELLLADAPICNVASPVGGM